MKTSMLFIQLDTSKEKLLYQIQTSAVVFLVTTSPNKLSLRHAFWKKYIYQQIKIMYKLTTLFYY